jgi:ABC-2 type transport system ATP-binding protein
MIQAKELSKRYGGTLAVDGLTFDVRPGRVTGFLGPNGSGKSTTLRMALGLDLPTAGSVTVNGCPYRRLPRPLYEVGALLDANAVHGGRSAYDHLLALAQSNRIGRRRVGEVLDLVGLAAVAGQRVGGFSLGMRQRLGIAAALLGDPGVLMLDEPVNGLDPEGIRWIRGLLRSLAAEGRTVFVSSHLMSEMAQTADHLVVIGKGRLIADRSLAEFIQGAGTGQVLVRTPDADRLATALGAEATVTREADGALLVAGLTAARVGEAAAAAGVVLHELSPRTSLEEAFMELTADAVEYTSTGGTR